MKLFKKSNPVGKSLLVGGGALWQKRTNKKAFAEEGYCQNVIVYRAIREITTGIASIAIEYKRGDDVLKEHDVLDRLKRPNPMQGWDNFVKNIFTDYLIWGELFLVKSGEELWPLNPLHMDVKKGPAGIPRAYVHEVNNQKTTFEVDQITGKSEIFMQKMYNPLDYWRGMSPLEAASLAGDAHNAGLKWNYSLLKNSARPSGIVRFPDDPSAETVGRVREFFKKAWQGENKAGEIPALSGGAEWQQVDNSPRDMDFLNVMRETAKYVASAYGVPLPLIDNDAASYNNIEQAKERLWTDTILPMFDEFLNQFSAWYLEDGELVADLDDIPALEGVRTRHYNRVRESVKDGLLSIDEGRVSMGYDPRGGMADAILVPQGRIPLDMVDFNDQFEEELRSLGYSELEIKAIFDAAE